MRIQSLLLVGMLCSMSLAVYAQQEAYLDEVAESATESERIVRLQSLIESDQEMLVQLKDDLKQRENATEQLARELTEREQKLDNQETRIEGMAEGEEKTALQARIAADRQKLRVARNLTETAFQTEKAIRIQIQALEEKIVLDRQALDEMLGTAEDPTPVESMDDTATAVSPQADATPSAPGIQDERSELVDDMLPETPEQIEARRMAERVEQEAAEAEQAVMNFLEQKVALQYQIDLETSLLRIARETQANLEQGEQLRRQEYTERNAAGAEQAELDSIREKLAGVEADQREIEREIDERQKRLESLHQRMQELQEDQLEVTAEAERMREEAESARSKSRWLESPLNPRNISRWAQERGPNILTILLAVAVLLVLIRLFLQRFAHAVIREGRRQGRNKITRAATLAQSLGNAVTVVLVILGLLLIFEAAGVNLMAVLGGAAIIGFAFAFGAQNLMRDYFNGLIILIEDQYELNDIVTINDTTGRVERVSLRTTALRDLEGKLHFIPNGEIKSVTNRSYEWAQIVFDIRVSYRESADRVMEEIMTVAREVCADPDYGDAIMSEPEMFGVDRFGDFGFHIKCILKTSPGEQYRVRREVLRRIKNRFDELGIEIPAARAAAIAGH